MTNSPDERGLELRELFFETSLELLQALNEEALKLEKTPGDEEIVRGIRRTVHTLKGDSAACGMRELSELAHQFEDALSLESSATQSAVAEIAFAAADVFTDMIAAYRTGGKLPSTKTLSQKIEHLTAPPAPEKVRGASKPTGRKLASKISTARKSAGKKSVSKKSAGAKSARSSSKKLNKRSAKSSGRSSVKTSAKSSSRSSTAKTSAAPAKVASLWTEYEKLAMTKAQAAGLSVYHVVVKIDPHCAMPIAG